MRTNPILSSTLAVVLAFTAACADSTTEPQTLALDGEDMGLVAVDGDALAGGIVFTQLFGAAGSGAAAASEEHTREFSRSRDCPAGGTIEINGTVEFTQNGEGTVEATITGTRDQVNCTRTREDVTLVIDGSGTFEAYRKRVNGEPVGNQTTTYAGTFDWTKTRGDEVRTGSCEYSLESVRQPDAMKVKVTGTICGREIDRERDWKHGT
jgi:hypothetical protein